MFVELNPQGKTSGIMCTKHLVDCFFKFSGCNIQLTRNEMSQHTEENRSEHMAMMMKMVNELKEENAILRENWRRKNLDLNRGRHLQLLSQFRGLSCQSHLRTPLSFPLVASNASK